MDARLLSELAVLLRSNGVRVSPAEMAERLAKLQALEHVAGALEPGASA